MSGLHLWLRRLWAPAGDASDQAHRGHERAADDQESTHHVNVPQSDRCSAGVEALCEADEACCITRHVPQVHEHLGKSRD